MVQGKECFVPNSEHHIHQSVSGLGHTQSASVCGEGGSLSGLSDTFSQRDGAKVQNMSQTAGADGIGPDGHSAQPFAHETFSVVGGVAQFKPDAPRTASGLNPTTCILALHPWRRTTFLTTGVTMGTVLTRKVITTDAS